jgi:hypothetical protein
MERDQIDSLLGEMKQELEQYEEEVEVRKEESAELSSMPVLKEEVPEVQTPPRKRRVVWIRGELEVDVVEVLGEGRSVEYMPGQLLVNVSEGGKTIEGVVALSTGKVRKLTRLLGVQPEE